MKKIKLFACCIPVKGVKRSIICDIQRNTYKHIPNSMVDFLAKYEGYTVEEIKNDFTKEEQVVVDEYIGFLLKEEFVFFTDHPEYYPKIEPQWQDPSVIANAVIDHNMHSGHDHAAIFGQLNALRCFNLELRFFDAFSVLELDEILTLTLNGTLRSIDIVLKFESSLQDKSHLEPILEAHKRVNKIFVHSTPGHLISSLNTHDDILFTEQVIENETHCGNISKLNFSVNQNLFFESLSFNSCLNKKIAIDSHGQIKNCPSMKTSFGNISTTDLQSVVDQIEFKELWRVTKDQVHICKDCEFRYICTDCRAYLKDANDPYAKPGKCSYDPYSGTWA